MSNTPSDAEIDAFLDSPAGLTWVIASNRERYRLLVREVLAKWGTPPAVAGEPVAWLSTDCIGERYLCFTRPKDGDPARPLVFGDTLQPAPVREPQPMPDLTQLTERGVEAWAGVDAQALREGGITKGGQHGTE